MTLSFWNVTFFQSICQCHDVKSAESACWAGLMSMCDGALILTTFFFSSNILTFSCKFLVCVQFKTVVYQLSFQITHWSEILRWHRKKMVTHKQLTVGWCLVFKIEIRSSFYCIVLISSVCSLPFQGALCASLSFFMMLSPAKFLPFALGFSCTLDLPLFLLSTNYCLCILIKGGGWLLLLLAAPATIL